MELRPDVAAWTASFSRARAPRRWALALAVAIGCVAAREGAARAEWIAGNPDDHARYAIDLEPHATLGVAGPAIDPGAFGGGVRATFLPMQVGPIKTINDSLGLGLGLDLAGRNLHEGLVTAVGQWDFWLTPQLSAFGEAGLTFPFGTLYSMAPTIAIGGRVHIVERFAITLRVGYPITTAGLSLLL